jgi:maltooligosyltrehalose trehalohydrolase
VLLSPYIPLLFMGEEYGETAPFLYFIEHGDPELIEAVRAGRRREFEKLGLPASAASDPQAEETFNRVKLDWDQRESASGARLLSLYSDLHALRREEPTLKPGASVVHVEGSAEWCTQLRSMTLQGDIFDSVRGQRTLWCAFNLSGRVQDIPVPAEAPWGWRLRLSTDESMYGGAAMTTAIVPPSSDDTPAIDEPRRLIAATAPVEHRARTVRLAPWSAAVYVRDFEDGSVA